MSRLRTLAALVVTLLAALLALAASASGHVTVTSPDATRGGSDVEITFRVPVEEKTDTVGLTIQLPTNTPVASVLVDPIPGWTHTQKSSTLAKPIKTDDGDITSAVSQITWTAGRGNGLAPGEFGEFTIIAGQLPQARSLTFKALQTYADGSVTRWIETAAPGSTDEPEHPAPVLTLSAPAADAAQPAAAASAPSNTGPIALSIVALVVAAAALALAVVSRARKAS